eukprot:CAMPEP_0176371168 /NCGR_PEP_ID=MMETSP0126-20121128/24507_1 /TAXON_ID=141414 ORGANISM="Strombidinopsis acuminatum, Strain SPMC142" /NCGR_SAMPLE_ID=MMETSP0126 /ASSEMBLY_ACC=CAM_ASM_000229 /LENGTH=74 /DNA_ID=CAMNT_0017730513 /DNA_START=74 /DNA_END=298 /DNA_ORIENTATION=-
MACDLVAEWIFKDFDKDWSIGMHKVANSYVNAAGSPLYTSTNKMYLDYTYALDDPVIGKFNVHVDQNFGMQYAG